MSHHGTVDSAPDISDMLRRHCIRYLTIYKIVDSHAIQIHCSDAVIVGGVATTLALKDVQPLVAISLLGVPANRAGLTCISWIYANNRTLIERGFILQLLF